MNTESLKRHGEASKSGFASLEKVIEHCCSSCGLCVSLCPKEAIEMKETIPTLIGECNSCGFCYQGCPRSFFPLSKVKERYFGAEQTELEKRVGCFVDRFTARSLVDEIFEKGANGGTATGLTYYLLENKIVDAVLHLGSIHEDNYICCHGKAIISTRPEDTLKGCKSKYQLSPVLHDLKKVSSYERFAVVGLSCHVAALRKLQIMKDDQEMRVLFPGLAKVADDLLKNLTFVIAVNCFSNTRHGAIDKIYQKLGVREEDVIKHAENTKKTLYQLLNEGKNFLWYVQDGFMTRDGVFHPFSYTDFFEEAVSMGCMVCPSFIVCKEADVSIGVTASDIHFHEFGYNSVFVRNPQLNEVFKSMVREGKLLRRPMWDTRGKYLRKIVERVLPSKDTMGFREYAETGKWKPSRESRGSSSSAQSGRSGKILGLQRLLLIQTVKRKIMYQPAVKALQESGKFLTEML